MNRLMAPISTEQVRAFVELVRTGSIRLAGVDVTGRKPHQLAAAGLARTFQNIRLFGELSVFDNVRLGAQMRHAHLSKRCSTSDHA